MRTFIDGTRNVRNGDITIRWATPADHGVRIAVTAPADGNAADASTWRARTASARADGIGRRAGRTHPNAVGPTRAASTTAIGARPSMAAVDSEHVDAIEPRTFDRWHDKPIPAVKRARAMWRLSEKHPRDMVDGGYGDSVSDGQRPVAPITPHGRLKRLEGDPVERPRGVWASDMRWHDRNFRACRRARSDIINNETKEMR